MWVRKSDVGLILLSSVELLVSIEGLGFLYISAVLCFENENDAKTKECGMGIEDKTRGGMLQLTLSGQPLLFT